jgi:hypothetical protein
VRLITAHRILIGAAIAFFVVYAALALVHARPGAIVQAVVAVVIAGGLVVYYRRLSGWGRRP